GPARELGTCQLYAGVTGLSARHRRRPRWWPRRADRRGDARRLSQKLPGQIFATAYHFLLRRSCFASTMSRASRRSLDAAELPFSNRRSWNALAPSWSATSSTAPRRSSTLSLHRLKSLPDTHAILSLR